MMLGTGECFVEICLFRMNPFAMRCPQGTKDSRSWKEFNNTQSTEDRQFWRDYQAPQGSKNANNQVDFVFLKLNERLY